MGNHLKKRKYSFLRIYSFHFKGAILSFDALKNRTFEVEGVYIFINSKADLTVISITKAMSKEALLNYFQMGDRYSLHIIKFLE